MPTRFKSLTFNAASFDKEVTAGGAGKSRTYVYNVKNHFEQTDAPPYIHTLSKHVLEKTDIATGERAELELVAAPSRGFLRTS